MSTSGVGSTSGSSSSSDSSSKKPRSLQDMSSDDFMKLLLTELQQQDPMNPMDNAQMIEQISQIRSIASNTQLADSLKTVSLGQSISTAGSLLGRSITGLDSAGDRITGVVDKVTVSNSKPVLHIGDNEIELSNIDQILPTTTGDSSATSGS